MNIQPLDPQKPPQPQPSLPAEGNQPMPMESQPPLEALQNEALTPTNTGEVATATPVTPETPVAVAPETQPTVEQPALASASPVQSSAPEVLATPAVESSAQIAEVNQEATEPDEGDLDEKYFKAADQVIENLAGKPFEQKKMAEDLSRGYQHDRFGEEPAGSEE